MCVFSGKMLSLVNCADIMREIPSLEINTGLQRPKSGLFM